MTKCKYSSAVQCERMATTVLKSYTGETVQLCERHHDKLVRVAKSAAIDESEEEETRAKAAHWLVSNRIPA